MERCEGFWNKTVRQELDEFPGSSWLTGKTLQKACQKMLYGDISSIRWAQKTIDNPNLVSQFLVPLTVEKGESPWPVNNQA
jgi:hypothetical protein